MACITAPKGKAPVVTCGRCAAVALYDSGRTNSKGEAIHDLTTGMPSASCDCDCHWAKRFISGTA